MHLEIEGELLHLKKERRHIINKSQVLIQNNIASYIQRQAHWQQLLSSCVESPLQQPHSRGKKTPKKSPSNQQIKKSVQLPRNHQQAKKLYATVSQKQYHEQKQYPEQKQQETVQSITSKRPLAEKRMGSPINSASLKNMYFERLTLGEIFQSKVEHQVTKVNYKPRSKQEILIARKKAQQY